jgi:LuxR family maltose regulon positive regulatory protein
VNAPAEPVRHHVPRVPSWHVVRAAPRRLTADAPLLVVHGPAGAGKSQLLAWWARTVVPDGRPVIWLDGAAAPSGEGLWPRVRTALVAAGLLPEAEPATSAHRGGTGGAGPVVDELRRLVSPVVLVVDGYDRLASPAADDRLVQVLRQVEPLQVAVATRRSPARLLERAALHLDVAEIDPVGLALDAGETAEVLRRAGVDPGVAADATGRVRAATDGLALAVRAVAIGAVRGATDLRSASEGDLGRIAARGVVPALVDGRDDAYLRAARRLSVTESLTPRLAVTLAGGDGADVLAELEADGLGAWCDDAFVLTPVVRAALRADLDRAEPRAVDGLLRAVVEWGLATGALYPALHAAAETRDLDLLQTTVLRIWGTGQVRDAAETIRVLESLPLSALRRSPQLTLLLALLYNTRPEHRVKALEWFALAVAATVYHLPRATPAERAVLRTGESVAARLLGRGGRARAAAPAPRVHQGRVRPGTDPTVDVLRGLMHRQLGISLVAGGDVEHGLRVVDAALPHTATGSLAAFSTYSLLAGLHAVHGDLAAARHYVGVAEPLEPPARPETAYRRSTLELARAHLALDEGDVDRAEAVLTAMATELRTNEFWPAFAELQATVDLLRGRAVPGTEALDQRMRRGRRSPVTPAWRARLVSARSLLSLAAGQAEGGVAALRPVPSTQPAARVARARLLLSTGRAGDALALLAAPDLPDEGPRLRITRRLLLTAASALDGRGFPASRALQEAVAIIGLGGSATGWMLLSPEERAAVHDVAADLGDPEVERVLARAAWVPPVVPDARGAVGLTERELVVLRELADDAELAEVAARLHVSHNTVKSQVRTAYRKLGVRRRVDALSRARELGLL